MADLWVPFGRPADRETKTGLVVRDWNGRPGVGWPFGKVPHMHVVGSSGGGKSTFSRVLVTNLIRMHLEPQGPRPLQVIIDGKGAKSFHGFAGQPGVQGLYSGFEEALEAFAGVREVMNRRYVALEAARQETLETGRRPTDFVEPPELFVIFDEYMVALGRLMRHDEDLGLELVDTLVDLGQLSRDARINLVLMMQRGDAKLLKAGLPGVLKDQLKAKVAIYGDVGFAPLEARMAFGETEARVVQKQIRPELGAGHVQIGGWHGRILVPWMADWLDPRTSEKDRREALSLLPASEEERRAAAEELGRRPIVATNVVDMTARQGRLVAESTTSSSPRQPTGGVKGRPRR